MEKETLLVIEDSEAQAFGYVRYLEAVGYKAVTARSCSEARKVLATTHVHVVLLDLGLPDGNGLELIPAILSLEPNPGIVIITGTGDIPTAVAAMKNGADNFLTKPVNMDELTVAIQKCIEIRSLRKQSLYSRMLAMSEKLNLGKSPAMDHVKEYAAIASKNNNSVLITGETGTGKGVLARWIHDNSPLGAGRFVEVNCSALKGELLRSELYGHARGAFTSAVKDRPGLIEIADGGTLFLDEIGDMALEVQAQMLKTIEEKSFRRIGENMVRTSNFRLACATNKDLPGEVDKGTFRSDLYYRINVFPIELPPLRERREDIPGLIAHFLHTFNYAHTTPSPEVVNSLQNRPWKGNIRELRNVVERAVLLADDASLQARHFSVEGDRAPAPGNADRSTWDLETMERETIADALEHFKGNKTRVCKELGISLSSLYRKVEKYRLETVSA